MRRNLLVAVLVGIGLSLCMWGVTAAQGQGARTANYAGAETRVALVDIAYVFKKYDKFNRLYDQMKADVKAREKEIADTQSELKSLVAKRQQFTPDSSNYKELDQKIAQQKAELDLTADRSRREFTQREANIYHQTYREVEDAVKRYAEYNQITLVLRSSRDDDTNARNPQDVIKEVSQQVIYALPQMDITDAILEMLNGKPTQTNRQSPTQPNKTTPGQPPKTVNKFDGAKPAGSIRK